MALKTKAPVQSNTGLKFKVRGKSDKKKVMIYGNDGTGKSTFAETYCNQHGLNPIVIDVDDTNYTSLPIVEVDLSSDLKAYKFVKNIVNEVASMGANVLAINQEVPINSVAFVTMTVALINLDLAIADFVNELKTVKNVLDVMLIAVE